MTIPRLVHAGTRPGTHALKQTRTAVMSETLPPRFTVFFAIYRRGLSINKAVLIKAYPDTTCRFHLYGISE